MAGGDVPELLQRLGLVFLVEGREVGYVEAVRSVLFDGDLAVVGHLEVDQHWLGGVLNLG